jgi:hypothetical protein
MLVAIPLLPRCLFSVGHSERILFVSLDLEIAWKMVVWKDLVQGIDSCHQIFDQSHIIQQTELGQWLEHGIALSNGFELAAFCSLLPADHDNCLGENACW